MSYLRIWKHLLRGDDFDKSVTEFQTEHLDVVLSPQFHDMFHVPTYDGVQAGHDSAADMHCVRFVSLGNCASGNACSRKLDYLGIHLKYYGFAILQGTYQAVLKIRRRSGKLGKNGVTRVELDS